MAVIPGAEQSSTNTYHGCSLSDGKREIMGHAHRKSIELITNDILGLFEQATAKTECVANRLLVIYKWSDCH